MLRDQGRQGNEHLKLTILADRAGLGDGHPPKTGPSRGSAQSQVESTRIGEGNLQRRTGSRAGAAGITTAAPIRETGDQGETFPVDVSAIVRLAQLTGDPGLARRAERGGSLQRGDSIREILNMPQAFFKNQFRILNAIVGD